MTLNIQALISPKRWIVRIALVMISLTCVPPAYAELSEQNAGHSNLAVSAPLANDRVLQDPNLLLRSLGIARQEWGILSEFKELLLKVNALPVDVKALYKSLSFFEKLRMNAEVNGTTDTPLFTINNKEAFISGTVKGYDTFKFLESDAEEAFKSGKITQEECDRRIQVFRTSATLTPDQRTTLVAFLDMEMKAHK